MLTDAGQSATCARPKVERGEDEEINQYANQAASPRNALGAREAREGCVHNGFTGASRFHPSPQGICPGFGAGACAFGSFA